MSSSTDAVSLILRHALSALLQSLTRDIETNFIRKSHNFLLASFDADALFYAVFTSSFESKSGNALEACAKQIACLRYGQHSVPAIIKGLGATDNDVASFPPPPHGGQVILTRKNLGEVQEHAAQILRLHKRSGRGSTASARTGLTQSILQQDILARSYPDDTLLHHKPVDLFVQPTSAPPLCMEIKLGGDLDNSNAPGQLAKLVTLCALTGCSDTHGYFATIYNKDGEGRRLTGAVTSYLAGDMILAGSEFWNTILPSDLSFDDFCRLYAAAWQDVNMNATIRALITRLIPGPIEKTVDLAEHLTG